jgi:hypothetical protein
MAAVAQRLETHRTVSGGNELRAWFSLAPEDATLT